MRLNGRTARINLALQGGGAHGAFTWGVLDRLLEEDAVDFGWVSGTSAGAINAVALASGLAEGGPAVARARLKDLWDRVLRAGVPDLLRLNPFLYSLSRSPHMAQVASLWSPYDFNPLGFDPLRRLLNDTIDFERLRAASPVELVISATDIATGRPRHFRRHEITVETLLASACLPTLHHAVVIEGRAYWDGGFSSNPDLLTIAAESPIRDTLLVLINPIVKPGLPTGVREIADHANRLTFNAPLLRDVEIIDTARKAHHGRLRFWQDGPTERIARHRFHMIEAGRYTSKLRPESKGKPEPELLSHLFGAGRLEAGKWTERGLVHVGRRASIDIVERLLHPREGQAPGATDPESEPPQVARQAGQG